MRKPVGPEEEGFWSAEPLGKSRIKRGIIIFQYKTSDGEILDRFAVQACNCTKPMMEYFPKEMEVSMPGLNPHDQGDKQKGVGWSIWCDVCGIHAGPHSDRRRTIYEWNNLVEVLKTLDEL